MNQDPTDRPKPVDCEFNDMVLDSARKGGFDNGVSREEFYENQTVWERVTREFLRRVQVDW